ncbi:hypothetical protein NL676_013548 [Syzygium grande]|nr:hypothetical protein NL676_013548 [Syzygium grande]
MVTGGASTASHGGAWYGRNAWLNDCRGGDSKDSRLETLRDTRFGKWPPIVAVNADSPTTDVRAEVAGCSSVRLGTGASSSDGEQKRRQGRCQAGKIGSEQFLCRGKSGGFFAKGGAKERVSARKVFGWGDLSSLYELSPLFVFLILKIVPPIDRDFSVSASVEMFCSTPS